MKFNNNEILVLGNGQLGAKLLEIVPGARNLSLPDIDFLDYEGLRDILSSQEGVKVLINAIAWVDADSAENRNNRNLVRLINQHAIACLVEVSREKNWILVHVSSDYIFDGTISNISEDDIPNPMGMYGRSKRLGDEIALIHDRSFVIRTSWVIGDSFPSDSYRNFAKTMVNLLINKEEISVVNDQHGRLTFTSTLAEAIIHLIKSDSEFGIYNVSNSGEIRTWYGIAVMIRDIISAANPGLKLAGIRRISSEEWRKLQEINDVVIARRPENSDFDLSKIKAAGFNPDNYDSLLERYVMLLLEEKNMS